MDPFVVVPAHLVDPSAALYDERLADSFRDAMGEVEAEGMGDSATHHWIREWGAQWGSSDALEAFIAQRRADWLPSTVRAEGFVPQMDWWWVRPGEYLGRISLRPLLTDRLLEWGGHVGYDVRPSARRQGHATRMLSALLPIARTYGLDRILLTCDLDNHASARVIEANRGVFEDERVGKRRYWIDLD